MIAIWNLLWICFEEIAPYYFELTLGEELLYASLKFGFYCVLVTKLHIDDVPSIIGFIFIDILRDTVASDVVRLTLIGYMFWWRHLMSYCKPRT